MATDKLKKEKARLSQPPDSAAVPGLEGAYSSLDKKGKYSESYEKSGHMQSEERPAAPGGVLRDQPREHGNQYPGRPIPPTQPVSQATVKTGVAKSCLETQTDANRREMNQRVAKKGQP